VQPLDTPDAGAQTVEAVASHMALNLRPSRMTEPSCDHASDHSVIQTRKVTDREVVCALFAENVLTG
jgi:hypothetical protein